MDYESFYQSLKYHLKRKGYGGQALVCRHTGIQRSYLSRIMKKNRRAGARSQAKIAEFFGFSLDEFVEIGRRITLGENPEESVDLMKGLPVEQLLQRLSAAVHKEVMTARELNRAQVLYEDIVENSPQMIIRFNAAREISFINRAGEMISGESRAQLLGREFVSLFAEGYRRDLLTGLERCRGRGGSFSLEALSRANYRWVALNITIFPEGDENRDSGQLVGFDFTEKKKLDDRLRFIQHGVEMSYVPTLWIGDYAEIVYVNRAASELLGYSRDELEKMHVWDINPLITEDVWPEKWAWFQAEEDVVFAGQYKTRDGRIIPVEFHVSNLKYPDGRRYNVVFVKQLVEA